MKKQMLVLSISVLSAVSITGCSSSAVSSFEDKVINLLNNGGTSRDPKTVVIEDETTEAQHPDIFRDSDTGDETVESGEDMIEPETENQYENTDQITYIDETGNTDSQDENGGFFNTIPTIPFETRESTVSPDASMDDNGEYHLDGYHLRRTARETLPPSAIVGAEINYDIYRKGETEPETSEETSSEDISSTEETKQQIIYVTQPETTPAPTTAAPTTAAETTAPETTKAPTSPEDDPELVAQRTY